ncbi:Crossover junction endonuclease MUS81, partial [Trichinella pseudospiralis]
LKNVVYLIEEFDGMDSMAEYKKLLVRGACAKTQLIDQFHFVRTHNLDETVVYLKMMTEYLRRSYADKSIWLKIDNSTQLTLNNASCCAQQLTVLQRFAKFDFNNRKQKQWTVSEVFARMLLQFHGISAERAQQIVNKYPTLAHLLNAYATAERNPDGNEPSNREIPLLAEIRSGMLGRNLGDKLAKKIQFFFTSTEPFQM